MIHFQILSLFPQIFQAVLQEGVVGSAFQKKICQLHLINPRDFSDDSHRSVDDRPFGGGDGMVMRPEILEKALNARPNQGDHVIYLSPQGTPLTESRVMELSKMPVLTLVCGRYAGVDQRFINTFVDEEISMGDFVLSGGELPALCLIDAIARKLPGVLGHSESAQQDSFSGHLGLEGPLFTRPQTWQGQTVPSVLLSGDHAKIAEWRLQISRLVTLYRRPDLNSSTQNELANLRLFFNKLSAQEKQVCGIPEEIWF